jgi:hypothetical protein
VPEEEPDAFSPGWVQPMGRGREDAIFVLAGSSLGIGRTATTDAPVWIDLNRIRNVDALGDPADDTIEVELTLDDGRTIAARWTESFCDRVVSALVAGLEGGSRPVEGAPAPSDVAPSPPPASAVQGPAPHPAPPPSVAPVVLPSAPVAEQVPPPVLPAGAPVPPHPSAPLPQHDNSPVGAPPAPEPAPGPGATEVGSMFAPAPPVGSDTDEHGQPEASPAPGEGTDEYGFAATTSLPDGPLPGEKAVPPGLLPAAGSTALVLEDVVYLRGYPGQNKKRKKCVVTLTDDAIDLQGPGGLSFRVAWDAVQTVEAQNSDEARFRMNTKVHRDATLLVVVCQQDVTILLEARDCPTIPLRSAISQLVSDLRVVVV